MKEHSHLSAIVEANTQTSKEAVADTACIYLEVVPFECPPAETYTDALYIIGKYCCTSHLKIAHVACTPVYARICICTYVYLV